MPGNTYALALRCGSVWMNPKTSKDRIQKTISTMTHTQPTPSTLRSVVSNSLRHNTVLLSIWLIVMQGNLHWLQSILHMIAQSQNFKPWISDRIKRYCCHGGSQKSSSSSLSLLVLSEPVSSSTINHFPNQSAPSERGIALRRKSTYGVDNQQGWTIMLPSSPSWSSINGELRNPYQALATSVFIMSMGSDFCSAWGWLLSDYQHSSPCWDYCHMYGKYGKRKETSLQCSEVTLSSPVCHSRATICTTLEVGWFLANFLVELYQ